jgi:hypothetical protein
VRKSVLFACLCAGPAFAADEVGGIGRMDFADTPAFHSVFETRVPQPVEARRSASVSAKVRIAMWASGSTLPAQPEILAAIQPSAIAQTRQPSETIVAKTVRSAYLEESSPPDQSVIRKRFKRHAYVDPSEIEDDSSSFLEYQRRALSNGADLDDEQRAAEDRPPFYLGRPLHKRHLKDEYDEQPSLLGRIFGALFPG